MKQVLVNEVTEEMNLSTTNKFSLWDEVVSKHYMEGSPEQISYSLKLLRDPTIYMYAFFKNKEDEPMKLYSYQDVIINDPNKRIIFAAANQIGKSVTLCCKALHYSLTNPGTTVLMVSKTLPQSKDLLREIRRLLNTSTLDYKEMIGDSENKTEIYFRHFGETESGETVELSQSRIVCVPATEAALGYPADLMLIDELAFYDDGRYFYFQIAQPRTYTTKGQIIVFSNPNGQQGAFWELWNDNDFNCYNFNYLDKPGNTLAEYEALRRKLTKEEFDSTVNAVFTSPSGGFISLDERKAMQEERPNFLPSALTQPVFIFFDFAKAKDRTVRTIGIPYGKGDNVGVYVYEMLEYAQGTHYNNIIDELESLIKLVGEQNVAGVGWDNSGVGKGLADFIKRISKLGVNTIPVEFSLVNKSRLYTTFKLLVEKNLREGEKGIKIPYIAECDYQLAQLKFQRTSRGYLQVHHKNERDRDDFPDSLAGLCSLIANPDFAPVTAVIVGPGGDEDYSGEFSDEELGFV